MTPYDTNLRPTELIVQRNSSPGYMLCKSIVFHSVGSPPLCSNFWAKANIMQKEAHRPQLICNFTAVREKMPSKCHHSSD